MNATLELDIRRSWSVEFYLVIILAALLLFIIAGNIAVVVLHARRVRRCPGDRCGNSLEMVELARPLTAVYEERAPSGPLAAPEEEGAAAALEKGAAHAPEEGTTHAPVEGGTHALEEKGVARRMFPPQAAFHNRRHPWTAADFRRRDSFTALQDCRATFAKREFHRACATTPDDRAMVDAEIERIRQRTWALKKQLREKNLNYFFLSLKLSSSSIIFQKILSFHFKKKKKFFS
jgi:hypothetical protein